MSLKISISPGVDCKDTPVPDPHHFKVVDDGADFVSQYNSW